MFVEEKIAQMAAFFVDKEGGTMPHLKLMKLLYLSDRKSMSIWGYPISYDRMVSMPHGPVLSLTLGLINGENKDQSCWDSWISDKSNHMVSLNRSVDNPDQLGKLSNVELETMKQVWDEFGYMNQWDIRDYTHDCCPEWQDPNGSSMPIHYEDVFKALGHPEHEAKAMKQGIESNRYIDDLFASL